MTVWTKLSNKVMNNILVTGDNLQQSVYKLLCFYCVYCVFTVYLSLVFIFLMCVFEPLIKEIFCHLVIDNDNEVF